MHPVFGGNILICYTASVFLHKLLHASFKELTHSPCLETGITQGLGSVFVASESVTVVSQVTLWTMKKGGRDSAAHPALPSLEALLITKVHVCRYVQTAFLKCTYVDMWKLHSWSVCM